MTRIGKFEQADNGTLMMDEIGEMKPSLQAKLLHVLQDNEFTKLGSNKRVSVDVRVIAATNRDLEAMMMKGEFREDLYYRLKVIEIIVPALRERRDEIPHLIDFFTAKYTRKYNRPARAVTDELRQQFMDYEWPGNIRELENMIKRIVILQDEQLVIREIERNMQRAAMGPAAAFAVSAQGFAGMMQGTHGGGSLPIGMMMPAGGAPAPAGTSAAVAAPPAEPAAPATAEEPGQVSLSEVARAASMQAERVAIERTLRQVHWNRRKAAQLLGVSYKTLLNKMKECGISAPTE
jgi:DNA-binding NtrC family response regulator